MKKELKLLEPRIGEIFTLNGRTLICVTNGEKTGYCLRCALYRSLLCVKMKCAAQNRADSTYVHFVSVQNGLN